MESVAVVLARVDYLTEVANRAAPHRLGQRPVDPYCLVGLDQVAADQVAAGQVLMAGDGGEVGGGGRQAREEMGHMFDEAGFATTSRSLEQHRQTGLVGGFENLDLVADREVVRGVMRVEMTAF